MSASIDKAEVFQLIEGYTEVQPNGSLKACGTASLVKDGQFVIVVDTGGPEKKKTLMDGLLSAGVTPNCVTHVVCTHSHLDHIGNLSLFEKAKFYLGWEMAAEGIYTTNDLKAIGAQLSLTPNVSLLVCSGHTAHDTVVVVKNTAKGTVVVAGDIFECENDLKENGKSLWTAHSYNVVDQTKSRQKLLTMADYIIPGHGKQFKVPK